MCSLSPERCDRPPDVAVKHHPNRTGRWTELAERTELVAESLSWKAEESSQRPGSKGWTGWKGSHEKRGGAGPGAPTFLLQLVRREKAKTTDQKTNSKNF